MGDGWLGHELSKRGGSLTAAHCQLSPGPRHLLLCWPSQSCLRAVCWGALGCATQAWAASKSQLPCLDMGDAEQSCCFLSDLGLWPPEQELLGGGDMTATSFPSRSFRVLGVGTSLRCCAPAMETFVFSPGLLCGKGFFLILSLDPAGSDLLEPGLLPKPTCKRTDPLLFCCGLSLDVASFDYKTFFSPAISSSLIFLLGGFSGLAVSFHPQYHISVSLWHLPLSLLCSLFANVRSWISIEKLQETNHSLAPLLSLGTC